MLGIAPLHGLAMESLNQLGIDGFAVSSEPFCPAGCDNGFSLVGRLPIAFDRGPQVDVVLFELLLLIQR